MEELLFFMLVRRVEEFGYDLVFRQGKVNPPWIRQNRDKVLDLLVYVYVRVARKLLRVIDERNV